MINDIRIQLALAYKVHRVTKFIDDDIKQIKKLNQILVKMERSNKEQYILESINIVKQLDNVFDLDLLYPSLCELIDFRFHSTLLLLYDKVNNTTDKYIKKLQELSDNEE